MISTLRETARKRMRYTSSLFDCFVLLALYEDPASLGRLSNFGRGMLEGLSE